MDTFIHHISSFPTIIFTGMLFFMLLYWLVAAVGLADIDLLDVDIDLEPGSLEGVAGLLFKLGLTGVPLTLVLTIMAMVAWVCSYLLMSQFVEPFIPDSWQWIMAIVAGLVASIASIRLTPLIIKPLQPLFLAVNGASAKDYIGQTAIVRSSKVTPTFGEARIQDGGAGLLVNIRADSDLNLIRGDRVVLVELQPGTQTYQVVTEKEFLRS